MTPKPSHVRYWEILAVILLTVATVLYLGVMARNTTPHGKAKQRWEPTTQVRR